MGSSLDHPNALQRLVRRIARSRPGGRLFSILVPPLDRWALRITRNRLTATTLLAGYPVITLTTTGAKSGLPRQTILLAAPDGERLVLIASNFGNASHPAWYHNLSTHPQVQVEWAEIKRNYIARIAQGDERQHLWELAVAYYPGYNAYRKWAENREIPVVVLTPI
jgi:deazaflavin-dependent oxidoreductase (nitroreductase family)